MKFRNLLSFLVWAGLTLVSGCSRKGNDPLLDTPDPSITAIDTSVVDLDANDLKNFKVTFSAETDLSNPISGLKLGNVIIQEGWDYNGYGGFSPTALVGTSVVYTPPASAHPTAVGVPIKLTESTSTPGLYDLVFETRSQTKGYFSWTWPDGTYLYRLAWITVAYGDLTSKFVVAYRTE